MFTRIHKIGTSFALALVVGVAVGVTVATAAGPAPTPTGPSPESRAVPQYDRNASGKTYGRSGLGPGPADDPDLVLIVATNGRTGYSYRAELDGQLPASPAAAKSLPRNRTVSVYLSDGKTKIGEFVADSAPDKVESQR